MAKIGWINTSLGIIGTIITFFALKQGFLGTLINPNNWYWWALGGFLLVLNKKTIAEKFGENGGPR